MERNFTGVVPREDGVVEHYCNGELKFTALLEAGKSGIYTDKRGRKYKLEDGKRVALPRDENPPDKELPTKQLKPLIGQPSLASRAVRSKARVHVLGNVKDKKNVERAVHKLLGFGRRTQDVASLVGAPNDALVLARIDWDQTNKDDPVLNVKVENSEYNAERTVYKNDEGDLVIRNETFFIKPSATGKGLGTEVFARQIANALRFGVKYVTTFGGGQANGVQPVNGYYTWPRLGYDCGVHSIGVKFGEDGKKLRRKIRKKFPDAQRLQDIMRTREGRQWWKENGLGSDLFFDLTKSNPGSRRSLRVLNNYLSQKDKRRQHA